MTTPDLTAANAATDDAARLRGLLEASEMAAAGRWTIAMIDAAKAGDATTADYAANMARGHRANADSVAAIPNVTGDALTLEPLA